MDNINIETEKFAASMKNYIQNSDLPISIIYYVVKDICRDVKDTYYQYLNEVINEKNTDDNEDKS